VDEDYKQQVEHQVSEFIRNNFSFVVFEVSDKTIRMQLEKMMIATVAQCSKCKLSHNWFGKFSPKVKIRQSGLWLEQHLSDVPLQDHDMALLTEFMA